MKCKGTWIFHLVLSFVLFIVAWLSLTVNITTASFWILLAYSPWLWVLMTMMTALSCWRLNISKIRFRNDIKSLNPKLWPRIKNEILDIQRYPNYMRLPHLNFIMAGCLFVISPMIGSLLGYSLITLGVFKLHLIDTVRRYNFEKDRVIW